METNHSIRSLVFKIFFYFLSEHSGSGIVNLTKGVLTQRSTRVRLLTSEVEDPNPSGPQHK